MLAEKFKEVADKYLSRKLSEDDFISTMKVANSLRPQLQGLLMGVSSYEGWDPRSWRVEVAYDPNRQSLNIWMTKGGMPYSVETAEEILRQSKAGASPEAPKPDTITVPFGPPAFPNVARLGVQLAHETLRTVTTEMLVRELARRFPGIEMPEQQLREPEAREEGYLRGQSAPQEPVAATSNKMGLWRKRGIHGGKYLVKRRDGSIPKWPHFVLGAKDPAAPAALRAYANEAELYGFHPDYVQDIRRLANEFGDYRMGDGPSEPDAAPSKELLQNTDELIVSEMIQGKNG